VLNVFNLVLKESSAQLALGAAFGLMPPKEQVMNSILFTHFCSQHAF